VPCARTHCTLIVSFGGYVLWLVEHVRRIRVSGDEKAAEAGKAWGGMSGAPKKAGGGAVEVTVVTRGSLGWVSNEDRKTCSLCTKKFTMQVRRHHCRFCGEIICNSCSRNRVRNNIIAMGTLRAPPPVFLSYCLLLACLWDSHSAVWPCTPILLVGKQTLVFSPCLFRSMSLLVWHAVNVWNVRDTRTATAAATTSASHGHGLTDTPTCCPIDINTPSGVNVPHRECPPLKRLVGSHLLIDFGAAE
jgi:hypothetical protein